MDEKIRLDHKLSQLLPDYSRSNLIKMIKNGFVKVNSKVNLRPGSRVGVDDRLNYYITKTSLPSSTDLPVIYEDADCIVVDKPSGVLTHSKGVVNDEFTVESFVARYYTGEPSQRAGIVHRLDRLTSGVIICAKNLESQKWLQKQFSSRKVKKQYMAVVNGMPDKPQAIIDVPILRNPKKPQTFKVGTNGRSAITAYEVVKSNDRYSLLKIRPTTGRTHQIRVHLNYIGHPILGDVIYGGQQADRLYLHATQLEITLPSKNRKTFFSPTPVQFSEIIDV